MKNVLIFIEHRNDRVIRVCRQILSYFNLASTHTNEFNIHAFIYGKKISHRVYDELSKLDVYQVFSAVEQDLNHYNPEMLSPYFSNVMHTLNPEYILFSNTAIGKDFAPRMAYKFSSEMISDVIDINIENNALRFSRPIYGGKIFEYTQPESRVFVTIRSNSFEENNLLKKNNLQISFVHAKKMEELMYILKKRTPKTVSKQILTEAEVIVCGGGGMKTKENFEMLYELAELLGASVGASRAAVDAGCIARSALIGQTGKRVKPKLYLAFGVSGSMQHAAGMSTAGYVVAINKDPEALIFEYADFGIVGDLFKVLPLLISELRKYKEINDRCIIPSSDEKKHLL